MKIGSLNIEVDRHIESIEEFLKNENFDAVCLQEIQRTVFTKWRQQFFADGAFASMVSEKAKPYGEWGVAILTKKNILKWSSTMYDAFNEDYPELKEGRSERPLATLLSVECETMPGISISTTHYTWSPNSETSAQQIKNLPRLITALQAHKSFILFGDFNAPRGKKIYSTLSEQYKDLLPTSVQSTLDPILHRNRSLQLAVDGAFTNVKDLPIKVEVRCGLSDHCALIANIDI